ncbi:MAG: hypothetical protein GEV08_11810 [Acidimicrobiia bacterium]|nr:hypothetical protein [Acidimicrobiia bacterium]
MAAVVGGIAVLALLVGGAYALTGDGDGDGGATGDTSSTTGSTASSTTASTAPDTTPSTAATTTTTPTTVAADPCANPSGGFFVCISDIRAAGDDLVVDYEALEYEPKIVAPGGLERHIHFYFPVGPMAENPENAGTGGPTPGSWIIWDVPSPFRNGQRQDIGGYTVQNAQQVGATQLCALVADAVHTVYPGTGNCVDLPT